jgi:hypothetical protein
VNNVSGELPELQAKGNSPDSGAKSGNRDGLVICSITDRSASSPKYISIEDLDEALAPLMESKGVADSEYTVEFSPACIRVSRKRSNGSKSREASDTSRKAVNHWSDKSRLKMVERFASLDYTPFELSDSIPALITLTYPGDWLSVASTAQLAKQHLQSFRKRFERAYGRPFFALWKMEFQRRGAPHFHLLAPIPIGVQFSEWLSETWSDVVNHPNLEEREKHRLAGTGLDLAKGLTAEDAHLTSFYFSKH